MAAAHPPPLFDLDAVGFARDGRAILADVTWLVDQGDRWAVLGPNGCGKSTLLRLALGRLWPTAGTIRRLGRELVDLPAFWKRVGWIGDAVAAQIPGEEPAGDTVLSGAIGQFGLRLLPGLEPNAAERTRAATELARVGLSHLATRPFGVLSQGERQRVLVARALAADPLCLVLDEPCAGMDPGARERFLDWLAGWLADERADGQLPAVILVTHHAEEILPAFRQSLLLRAGRVIASGPTPAVLTQDAFEALYDTRLCRLERVEGRLWPIWPGPG
jgi:iron complex transport system ATP-binding protein